MNELEIFSTAVEIQDRADRKKFLEQACGDNTDLLTSVETLLQSAALAHSFLESPSPALAAVAEAADSADPSGDAPTTVDQPLSGILGDFRIIHEIARGGMGVVYEAEQISLGRLVALKVLPYASILDKTQLTRFRNEARAAASLDHPHVVHVHSVGTARGVHYYAMQLIEGQTIADAIEAERTRRGNPSGRSDASLRGSSANEPTKTCSIPVDVPPVASESLRDTAKAAGPSVTTGIEYDETLRIRAVVHLAIQAADALDHAHRMGIVHRDIKPSNLLVDAQQHLWVADFGLAMIESEGNITASNSMLGTLRYMSPEQLTGDRRVLDHRTDIYSLGVTLYEMLCLQPAFDGKDVAQLSQRIPHDDPTPPCKFNRSVPRDLGTIVLKAINKQPQDRYITAGALAEDLQSFLDDKPIRARRPSRVDRAKKWTRRHKGIVATATITLVVAALFASGFLWRERSHTLAALDREKKQIRRAEANLQLALQALDDLYLKSIREEELLLDETNLTPGTMQSGQLKPRLSEREQEFLRRGLAFYDQFAQQNRDNRAAAFETGKAFYRVAMLQAGLDQNNEAQAAYAESILRFKQLTQQHPTESEYFLELGKAFHSQGHLSRWWPSVADTFSEAETALNKVIELEPKCIEAFDLRGKVHRNMRKWDEAVADAEMTVQLDPNNPSWHIQLASLLWTAGDPHLRDSNHALRHAQRAVELDSRHANNRAVLGSIHFSLGQREAAVAEYQKAIELEDSPRNADYRRFQLARHLNDTKGIIEHASKCLVYTVPHRSSELAWIHVRRGQAYQSRGEIEKALSDYSLAEQVFPNLSRIYWFRGDLLAGQGRYGEALGDYNKFLELAPSQYHVYKRRAKAYFHLGHYDKALADLEESLALEPNDPSCVYWIDPGSVAKCPDEEFRKGVFRLAERAMEVTGDLAYAHAARGTLYAGHGQFGAALEDYAKSIELNRDDWMVHYWHALVQLSAGQREAYHDACSAMLTRLQESESPDQTHIVVWSCVLDPNAVDNYSSTLKLAEQAVSAAPKASHQRCLGAVLFRAGRFDEAIKTLGIAASEESDESSLAYTWYFLAMAHHANGHTDEAKKWLQKAVAWTDQAFQAEEVDDGVRLAWNRRLTLNLLREEAETTIGKEQP